MFGRVGFFLFFVYCMQIDRLQYLIALFVTTLLCSNILSTKLIALRWFTMDGGTLLFPLSYILGDIITELYGFKTAKKVILIGFGCMVFFLLNILLVGYLPAAPERNFQAAYQDILMATPRIMIASMIAYLIGELTNARLLIGIKHLTQGRRLPLRTIGSSIIAQGLDTIIFASIAFWGVYSMDVFLSIIIANYLIKLAVEFVATPITVGTISLLKRWS